MPVLRLRNRKLKRKAEKLSKHTFEKVWREHKNYGLSKEQMGDIVGATITETLIKRYPKRGYRIKIAA